MHHDIKIWPQYFSRVVDGSKTFEIRDNDRAYQTGDTVTLHEWDPEKGDSKNIAKGYTGDKTGPYRIGYVHVLDRNQVVFSLLAIKKSKT